MNKPLICLWTLCIAASVTVLLSTGTRAARAHSAAAAARKDLASVAAQAAELVERRSAGRDFPERSEGGLATRVSSALTRAGLPNQVLQSLSPEAQSPIGGGAGPALTRQRATLSLNNLSLPHLGRFLDAWRSAEPDWTVSSIDLSPLPPLPPLPPNTSVNTSPHTSKTAAALGTDLPLRAVITIEGLFKHRPVIPGAPR